MEENHTGCDQHEGKKDQCLLKLQTLCSKLKGSKSTSTEEEWKHWSGETFQLLIQILQYDPDDLNNGKNEGTKCQSASVIPEK